MSKHLYSYLALGDSYTIGESVALYDGFPYLTVQMLRDAGFYFTAPEIIAKTSWTSFELAEHILHTRLSDSYDFVSLLIGVNNQYRGLSQEEFAADFDFLLNKSIHLSGERPEHVFVLSIPDWGMTPFAKKSKKDSIGIEIDTFNVICRNAAKKHGAQFIDITEESRQVVNDPDLLSTDQLHYSAKEHTIWANKLADGIKKQLRQ